LLGNLTAAKALAPLGAHDRAGGVDREQFEAGWPDLIVAMALLNGNPALGPGARPDDCEAQCVGKRIAKIGETAPTAATRNSFRDVCQLPAAGSVPRLGDMIRARLGLWLLVTLVFIGQSVAAYAQRRTCFESGHHSAPAVEMDCHTANAGTANRAAGQPDCCGDSCPDMATCAVSPVAAPSVGDSSVPEVRIAPVERYAISVANALSAPPFRPPALFHA
jgi:hypothetical protein